MKVYVVTTMSLGGQEVKVYSSAEKAIMRVFHEAFLPKMTRVEALDRLCDHGVVNVTTELNTTLFCIQRKEII